MHFPMRNCCVSLHQCSSALSPALPLLPLPPRRLVALPSSPPLLRHRKWAAATAASRLRSARRMRSRWQRSRDRSWVHRRSRRCASARSATRRYGHTHTDAQSTERTRQRRGDARSGVAAACAHLDNSMLTICICAVIFICHALVRFDSTRTHTEIAHAQLELGGQRNTSGVTCIAAVSCCIDRAAPLCCIRMYQLSRTR